MSERVGEKRGSTYSSSPSSWSLEPWWRLEGDSRLGKWSRGAGRVGGCRRSPCLHWTRSLSVDERCVIQSALHPNSGLPEVPSWTRTAVLVTGESSHDQTEQNQVDSLCPCALVLSTSAMRQQDITPGLSSGRAPQTCLVVPLYLCQATRVTLTTQARPSLYFFPHKPWKQPFGLAAKQLSNVT